MELTGQLTSGELLADKRYCLKRGKQQFLKMTTKVVLWSPYIRICIHTYTQAHRHTHVRACMHAQKYVTLAEKFTIQKVIF